MQLEYVCIESFYNGSNMIRNLPGQNPKIMPWATRINVVQLFWSIIILEQAAGNVMDLAEAMYE